MPSGEPGADIIWRISGDRSSRIHIVDSEHPWRTRCGRTLPRRSKWTASWIGDYRCERCVVGLSKIGTKVPAEPIDTV